VELRRALLLFAIVLGLAAIASSIARPPEREKSDPAQAPATESAPTAADDRTASAAPGTTTLQFRAGGDTDVRRLAAGDAATVIVDAATAGQAEIPSLGLTQPVSPLTSARFDVLVDDPGRHPIVLRPSAAGGDRTRIGVLKVTPTGR
jgi:hypothetical protein